MSEFKVIIVGGGPVGLTAAHCLWQADINFELLEKRDNLDYPGGTTTIIWPQTCRILDQLGMLKEVQSVGRPLHTKIGMTVNGSETGRNRLPALMKDLFGYEWFNPGRQTLISLLRRRLPDAESRIHTKKEVTGIDVHDTGVKVQCADGSVHEGSIVLGTDGVYGAVKGLMNTQQSRELDKKRKKRKGKENRMKSKYAALYGQAKILEGMERDTFYDMHADGTVFQGCIDNDGGIIFLVYSRLEQPTHGRPRFTDAEKDAFVARYAHLHLTPTITLADCMANVNWSRMGYLEEGIADEWYGDRIVLAGDNNHKMTPNLGLGYNSGVQSVVAITNGLRRLLGESAQPSAAALRDKVFAPYEKVRRKNAQAAIDLSAQGLRVASWSNGFNKFLDRHVMPLINGDELLLKLFVSPLVQKSIPLDFLEETMFQTGSKKWKHGRQTGQRAKDEEKHIF